MFHDERSGTAGVQVCHVRDNVPQLPTQPTADLAKTLISDPRFTVEFPPNSYNEGLLRAYADRIQLKKRRERFLPPLPGWNPTGTVSVSLLMIISFFLFLLLLLHDH